MKCSEAWLREWVNPPLNIQQLSEKLTMAGLEVEEITPAAMPFSNVVIGEILNITPHPEVERLQICSVNVGKANPLTIVCGANNVTLHSRVPVALEGAILPGGKTIVKSNIRNALSEGMLCSSNELGLSESSDGLLILPNEAPIGVDLRTYLSLEDAIIDLSITPNRGDCLSIQGVAREISTLTRTDLTAVTIPEVQPSIQDKVNVQIKADNACSHYIGRIIRNINVNAVTPVWMQERLRRAGVRRINAIVDVTNYVMLELGQPMHAFDMAKIKGDIFVRQAKNNEKILLLDNSEQVLDDQTLIISDDESALAIAGVMGGFNSSVTLKTTDILLESAYFFPSPVAYARQRYHLHSESAYRFERGIDPLIQRKAIERATDLILAIANGEAGPITEAMSAFMPEAIHILLVKTQLVQTLGIAITDDEVNHIWLALKFPAKKTLDGWEVTIPSYRSDIRLPEDLIEEVARLYGYENIPTHTFKGDLIINHEDIKNTCSNTLKIGFNHQDYHEIISYSFIDKKMQKLFAPDEEGIELVNPITTEMAVMRPNLWPGLINTCLYNLSRQQERIRLFEMGLAFRKKADRIEQTLLFAGLVFGNSLAEQWGQKTDTIDFYDVKSNIHNVLTKMVPEEALYYKPEKHAVLHPGQTAAIFHQNKKIGVIGLLHPIIAQSLEIDKNLYLFELNVEDLTSLSHAQFKEWSKFPEIRRDIAILVNRAVPSQEIQDTIKLIAGSWLKNVFVFDVYQGKGISPDQKSIALALILQHPSRTLVDEEAAELVEQVVTALKRQLGAELRS